MRRKVLIKARWEEEAHYGLLGRIVEGRKGGNQSICLCLPPLDHVEEGKGESLPLFQYSRTLIYIVNWHHCVDALHCHVDAPDQYGPRHQRGKILR